MEDNTSGDVAKPSNVITLNGTNVELKQIASLGTINKLFFKWSSATDKDEILLFILALQLPKNALPPQLKSSIPLDQGNRVAELLRDHLMKVLNVNYVDLMIACAKSFEYFYSYGEGQLKLTSEAQSEANF